MTESPFRRQPKPTIITITGGDQEDRCDMARLIARYLDGRIDTVETSGREDAQIIRCYPGAVND